MKMIPLILAFTMTSFMHAATIDQLLEQARSPIDVKQQLRVINEKTTEMINKSSSNEKEFAERKRYIARLPEISKQLGELDEDDRRDEEVRELLESAKTTLEAAKTVSDATEQAALESVIKKQEATITLIEREEEKRKEEEEKAKAAANTTRLIRLNAPPAQSRGIFSSGRFRAPVRRTASRR